MLRPNRLLLMLVVTVAATLATGCGKSEGGASGDPGTTTIVTKPSGPPVVKIGKTKFGPTLVDARGHTLYVFDADPNYETTCIDGLCAYSWPALVVPTDSVPVGPGLKASDFTTIPGHDGVLVVAFNGRALYRQVADKKPGSVLGVTADDVWHPIGPDGEAIDG